MDQFVEYGKFIDMEMAGDLIAVLESNNIPFRVDDRRQHYAVVASGNPAEDQIIVKVRKDDFEKVHSVFKPTQSEEDSPFSFEHFLYTFSDDDLIEVIANPVDWTKEEQEIANKIITQKGITITPDKIKNARKKSEASIEEMESKRNLLGSAGWFFWIGILSIINTFIISFHVNFHFIFGLGITQIIDALLLNNEGNIRLIGALVNIAIASVFFVIFKYAVRRSLWAYIFGIALYALDTLMFLFIEDWFSLVFHIFALAVIVSGFITFRKELARIRAGNINPL